MAKYPLRDETGRIYFGWFVALLGLIIMTFNYACTITCVGVFLMPVTQDLGFSIGDFTMYITVLSLGQIVFLFFFTRFMNEKHIRKMLIIACFVLASTFIGFACATKLWHFYVLAGIQAFGFACTITPVTILINNWFGVKMKGFALSIALLGPSIGGMIMVSVLNAVVQAAGWRMGFATIAALQLFLTLPCVLKFAVWDPSKKGLRRLGESEEDSTAESKEKPGVTLVEARKKPIFWIMLSAGTMIVFASVALLQHTQTFLVQCGFTATQGATVISALTGLLALGCFVEGAIIDRFGRKGFRVTAVTAAILFALCFFCHVLVPYASWVVILIILFYGFGTTSVNVISPLMINHMYGEKDLGAMVGYVNMFIALGGSFGATVVGYMYDASGSYIPAWYMLTAIVLLAALIRFVCTSKKYTFNADK